MRGALGTKSRSFRKRLSDVSNAICDFIQTFGAIAINIAGTETRRENEPPICSVFDSQAKVAPSRLLVSLVTLSNVIFNCWNDKAQGTLTVSPLPRGLLGAVIPEMLVSVTIEVIG